MLFGLNEEMRTAAAGKQATNGWSETGNDLLSVFIAMIANEKRQWLNNEFYDVAAMGASTK